MPTDGVAAEVLPVAAVPARRGVAVEQSSLAETVPAMPAAANKAIAKRSKRIVTSIKVPRAGRGARLSSHLFQFPRTARSTHESGT
jgi:hypothetical protein